MTANIEAITTAIEDDGRLDAIATRIGRVVAPLGQGPARNLLSGRQLGHALHPMLTDLPIGFWTTSFVLDLVGGSAGRDISRRCIALGLATVPATALAGWSDWSSATASSTDETLVAEAHKAITDPAAIRRVGVVHAALNGSATLAYAASWLARRRGKQATGVAWGLIGATAATAAGHLGGHLVFRLGTSVGPQIPPLAAHRGQQRQLESPMADTGHT